jgi:hypothetical protein
MAKSNILYQLLRNNPDSYPGAEHEKKAAKQIPV